jgi:hypothetical protein
METITMVVNVAMALCIVSLFVLSIVASFVGVLGTICVLFPESKVYFCHYMVIENIMGRHYTPEPVVEEDRTMELLAGWGKDMLVHWNANTDHRAALPKTYLPEPPAVVYLDVPALSNNRGSAAMEAIGFFALLGVCLTLCFVLPTTGIAGTWDIAYNFIMSKGYALGLIGGTITLSYADSARIFGCCGAREVELMPADKGAYEVAVNEGEDFMSKEVFTSLYSAFLP